MDFFVAGGVVEEENTTTKSPASIATAFAKKQGLNDVSRLNPSNLPCTPRLDPRFPLNWNDLVTEWSLLRLEQFHGAKTTLWLPDMRQRYSKRLGAIQQLRKYKTNHGIDTDLLCAEVLEEERDRRKLTLTSHYDFLVFNDPTIMRRKRKRKSAEEL